MMVHLNYALRLQCIARCQLLLLLRLFFLRRSRLRLRFRLLLLLRFLLLLLLRFLLLLRRLRSRLLPRPPARPPPPAAASAFRRSINSSRAPRSISRRTGSPCFALLFLFGPLSSALITLPSTKTPPSLIAASAFSAEPGCVKRTHGGSSAGLS